MKLYFTAFICLLGISVSAQNLNLKINEIIADNNAGMMDDFFAYDDWIEIYNPAGNPIPIWPDIISRTIRILSTNGRSQTLPQV